MSSIKVGEKNARVGAKRQPDGGWDFLVWAPQARDASLIFPGVSDHAVSMNLWVTDISTPSQRGLP
jgi:1,4-alpha-glucan branching enzyme